MDRVENRKLKTNVGRRSSKRWRKKESRLEDSTVNEKKGGKDPPTCRTRSASPLGRGQRRDDAAKTPPFKPGSRLSSSPSTPKYPGKKRGTKSSLVARSTASTPHQDILRKPTRWSTKRGVGGLCERAKIWEKIAWLNHAQPWSNDRRRFYANSFRWGKGER